MESGKFYFLKDQYYLRFPDELLMKNKGISGEMLHDRPCFCVFRDVKTNLYWAIPISSKIEKYQKIYEKKVEKFGRCDTILFGEVLGRKKAFLIQNMCPIVEEYIKNVYMDETANIPVRVNGKFERQLIRAAKKVLLLQRKGIQLIYPNVLQMEQKLLSR